MKMDIKIAIPLFIPLYSIHLQTGYRMKLISNEKLNGIKSVLPKYNITEVSTIN